DLCSFAEGKSGSLGGQAMGAWTISLMHARGRHGYLSSLSDQPPRLALHYDDGLPAAILRNIDDRDQRRRDHFQLQPPGGGAALLAFAARLVDPVHSRRPARPDARVA